MHSGQPNLNLWCKRRGLEDLLEIVGLEVMAESVRAGTHSYGWRERILDCRSCNTEMMGTKRSVDIWDVEQIVIWQPYRTMEWRVCKAESRWAGWDEWRVWKVILAILKWTWCSVGSRWRLFELEWRGVMWRARRFCAVWSLERFFCAVQCKTELS